jgi:hypothetical protein
MSAALDQFLRSLGDTRAITDAEFVALLIYFLTESETATQEYATAAMVESCFRDCGLTPPARLPQNLSEGVSKGRYVKAPPGKQGYKLQRHYRDELSARIKPETEKAQVHPELRKLESRVTGPQKGFLKETIDCFEAGANRATIILCWILAIDHICDYTFKKHLKEFNTALPKQTDKRIRVTEIKVKDDFSEIPENKLIEILRSAGVISNDVRKILDEKLGVRNSCAHPSGIAIKPSKVIEFVDDLVENVVLKYVV